MASVDQETAFADLLHYLKRTRGFDFGAYKHSSLMRRVQKRMGLVGIEGFGDYVDYLEVHPEEFSALFNIILINVTGFFRDPPMWEYLAERLLPQIVAGKGPDDLIRVWSAGCASGEEAYTISMLLAEVLGKDRAIEQVKIYATDVDDDALNKARQAMYSPKEVEGLPPDLLKTYFEQGSGGYVFDKDLRRSVIFGRHDLVQDAPISRVDLLVCRNTLMYFHAEAQTRILERFHFALNDTGFLFLGRAEMLLTHGNLFAPFDWKRRVFSKVPAGNRHERPLLAAGLGNNPGNEGVDARRLLESAFDADPVSVARVGVDVGGNLILANARARLLFGLTPKDVGRPVRDLEVGRRPVDLRPHIEAALSGRRPVSVTEAEMVNSTGTTVYLDVYIVPLLQNGTFLGVSISFLDVTRTRQLREELQHSHQELETAYEELQSTNEELETTNEELQSANEELETTNEELQSANEELETMNEELQSTNQEMETVNEQLRERSTELGNVNALQQSVLKGLRVAVVVVDADLRIRSWNYKAEDLWGLRADEVQGKHFLNLDIGLPVDKLRNPIRECLTGQKEQAEISVEALNRRGKTIQCKVSCTKLLGPQGDVTGVILLMEEVSP